MSRELQLFRFFCLRSTIIWGCFHMDIRFASLDVWDLWAVWISLEQPGSVWAVWISLPNSDCWAGTRSVFIPPAVRVPAIHDLQRDYVELVVQKPHTVREWSGNGIKWCLGHRRVIKGNVIVNYRDQRATFYQKHCNFHDFPLFFTRIILNITVFRGLTFTKGLLQIPL